MFPDNRNDPNKTSWHALRIMWYSWRFERWRFVSGRSSHARSVSYSRSGSNVFIPELLWKHANLRRNWWSAHGNGGRDSGQVPLRAFGVLGIQLNRTKIVRLATFVVWRKLSIRLSHGKGSRAWRKSNENSFPTLRAPPHYGPDAKCVSWHHSWSVTFSPLPTKRLWILLNSLYIKSSISD